MLCSVLTVIFCITATTKSNGDSVFFKVTELKQQYLLDHKNIVWNGYASSIFACSHLCAKRDECRGARFIEERNTCSLFGMVQSSCAVVTLKEEERSVYLENVGHFVTGHDVEVELSEANAPMPGTAQSSVVSSCQALRSPPSASGLYWIDPDGGSQDNAFRAYCDMETDGGGWTLVWSYTFTDYNKFIIPANAITPRPNWFIRPLTNVPVSTTPPLNEKDFNALNFSLWKQIGQQILIKSNINNWLVCDPETGSFVEWQDGSVHCRIVKRMTDTCKGTRAPSKFSRSGGYGPLFYSTGEFSSTYYYFDGSIGYHWPTHDPCGSNGPNHLCNVKDPHGNIYVRK